jgi:aspartate/methionine/tyrosine aminotransferase
MSGVSSRASRLVVPPFDALNQKAALLRERGRNVISLGQAVPGFPPPSIAIEAARQALLRPEAHRYSADAGLLSLREALCDRFLIHLQIDAHPDDLIVTAGANQAFMLAAMAAIDPGDEVVLAAPYFVNHEMAIRAVGGVPVEAAVGESSAFAARWEHLEPHLTSRTRAVVLCTPSNPTGAVIGGDDVKRIVSELSSRRITLVCDETYLHFVFDGVHTSAASVPGWRDNVIVVGTFSKSFAMTGWRVGFMLADRRICEQAVKIQDAMIICAPVVSQIAVEAAVRDDWNYMHAFHDDLRARRAALTAALAEIATLHWAPTGGGFFAFVRVAGERDSERLAGEILDRADVVTIPGGAFGRSGEGFLRLSYGAASVDDLREACSRLKRFFTN